ncbi:LysR substrate-binding domain-containing protein [Paraburkholderia sp. NPDC080076]|uniref:LysR substrate-binding domain-containing protein n=1 Tax=Paraburkholderia sp. NPDC080076 TaxID=3390605 RepID=UPI003D028821
MRKLPSINHLRSLQVIGRHLNMVRAAEELHLSSSTLSYQLHILEEQLGVKLFVRTSRGLVFTPRGEEVYREVDENLCRLTESLTRLTAIDEDAPLVVTSLPTFASRWLLPRFATLQKLVKNVELRISTVDVNFTRDHVDCAILYGDGNWPNLSVKFLRSECLALVCAPGVVSDARPLKQTADLRHHTLLSARRWPHDWECWVGEEDDAHAFAKAGHLVLESRNLVIEAALNGLGVALVDPVMVQRELRCGSLVKILPKTIQGRGAYYFAYPHRDPIPSRIELAYQWLISEMEKEASGLKE